jgi:glucan phosphoethanolaminetransferase (alkaline phosphatase superfamily)
VFGEFHNLPVHILIIHAVVVLVPLAGFLGILFVIPKTRQWARNAFALVTVGAMVMTFVARQSGIHLDQNLAARSSAFTSGKVGALIATHQSRGKTLFLMMVGFAIIAVAAWILSREPARFHGPLAIGVSALVIVAAVATGVQVIRVGEIGSKVVWNPTGDFNYSNP